AVWAPPDGWRVPVGATIREAVPMVRVFGRRLPLALWTRLRLERRHPHRPASHYLTVMGVEPSAQGRGLGSALLQPVLGEADREGVPAYLEASTPRSRALYERNGFAVTGEVRLPRNGP